ncbi:hypothetical protein LCGC14_1003470 [marine sediment metagenome]|uniref:Uncharacterized protein n=1 Tax=marine sediment metagenome TaxID=412755 RepID=A0A0F9NNT2_9ZZZZ
MTLFILNIKEDRITNYGQDKQELDNIIREIKVC